MNMWESTCTYVHMYVLAMCLGTCMCSTFSQSRSSTKRVNANSLLCVIRRVFSYRIFFFYYVIYTYNMCIYVCIHTLIQITVYAYSANSVYYIIRSFSYRVSCDIVAELMHYSLFYVHTNIHMYLCTAIKFVCIGAPVCSHFIFLF